MRAASMALKSSLVVVTHPRNGDPRHGNRLDNHAGGQAYNRFTQCVLALESKPDEDVTVKRKLCGANVRELARRNRSLFIRKARNGPGTGAEIAYWFDGKTLTFDEKGAIDD